MSYASDHIFGFPVKEKQEYTPKSSEYKRGTIGWCGDMVYVFKKRCKELETENAELKIKLRNYESEDK